MFVRRRGPTGSSHPGDSALASRRPENDSSRADSSVLPTVRYVVLRRQSRVTRFDRLNPENGRTSVVLPGFSLMGKRREKTFTDKKRIFIFQFKMK